MTDTADPSPDGTDTAAVYVISVAAELTGVHPQTLRAYEQRGLLAPARTRGGARRYSDHDIARIRRIATLTANGINLAGVEHILTLEAVVATYAEAKELTVRHEAEEGRSELQGRADGQATPTDPSRGDATPGGEPGQWNP